MNPSLPCSGPVTISPATAPALWQASLPTGDLQPVILSVRVDCFAPEYSPLPVPLEHVSLVPDLLASVVAPTAILNLLCAPAPSLHSNSPNLPPRLSFLHLKSSQSPW